MKSSLRTNATEGAMDAREDPRRLRQSGLTIVELATSLVVSTVLVAALGGLTISSQRVYLEVSTEMSLGDQIRRTMDRLVGELRYAEASSFNATELQTTRSLSFTAVEGWQDDDLTSTATRTIEFADNQLLMDGVVVASGLKDANFMLDGNILTISLQAEKQINVGKIARTVSRDLSTQLRF